MKASNFHQHCTFCDGKDMPEEIILEAIEKGCPAVGFSSHSFTDFDDGCCMTKEGTEEYINTVRSLREKYKGKIDVYLGIEQDYYSETSTEPYEYVIGSTHYILKNGEYLQVDACKEEQIRAVNEYYGGDFYSYVEDYYRLEADIYNKTHCDIVGHFDLVTKFNEGNALFDTKHPRYIKAVNSALDALLKAPVAFEINTGAVSRGYRSEYYPEASLLEKIKMAGKRIIYSSDCHDKKFLLYGIPDEIEDISDIIKHK